MANPKLTKINALRDRAMKAFTESSQTLTLATRQLAGADRELESLQRIRADLEGRRGRGDSAHIRGGIDQADAAIARATARRAELEAEQAAVLHDIADGAVRTKIGACGAFRRNQHPFHVFTECGRGDHAG